MIHVTLHSAVRPSLFIMNVISKNGLADSLCMRESHGNASDRNANNNQATLIDHFGEKTILQTFTRRGVGHPPRSSLTRHTYIFCRRDTDLVARFSTPPPSHVILAQRYTKKKGGNAAGGKKGNAESYTSPQTRHNGTRTMRRRSGKGGVRRGRTEGLRETRRRVRASSAPSQSATTFRNP